MLGRKSTGLALVLLTGMVSRAGAVSTYTCTTFLQGNGRSFYRADPNGINNQAQVVGYLNTNRPGDPHAFFVDQNGMSFSWTHPPFLDSSGGDYALTSVNNLGQVAGYGLDNTVSPARYRAFISNPDGTYAMVDPPADTATQSFSNIFIFSINDNGDVFGVLPIRDENGITTGRSFIRDSAGFFKLLGRSSYPNSSDYSPNLQSRMNNSRTLLLNDPPRLRLPDGAENPLVYPGGSTVYPGIPSFNDASFYGINNAGFIVGTSSAPFVMGPDGNAPAIVCPELRIYAQQMIPYAINDSGVIAGSLILSGATEFAFVATPTGFHSSLQLSNRSWGFSPSPAGQQGGSGIIYVSSTGVADLNIASISIRARDVYDNPADFSLTGNTCTDQQNTAGTIAPGQFCAASFTFKPSGVGARTAQIVIQDDAPDGPHVIRLDGTGLGKGKLQFSNTSWVFGGQTVGQTSGTGLVYIYNPGTDAITFSSIVISGANSSDFAIDTNTCGAALAPYTTCTMGFHFTTQGLGIRRAALLFNDDSGTGRQVVPLEGIGY